MGRPATQALYVRQTEVRISGKADGRNAVTALDIRWSPTPREAAPFPFYFAGAHASLDFASVVMPTFFVPFPDYGTLAARRLPFALFLNETFLVYTCLHAFTFAVCLSIGARHTLRFYHEPELASNWTTSEREYSFSHVSIVVFRLLTHIGRSTCPHHSISSHNSTPKDISKWSNFGAYLCGYPSRHDVSSLMWNPFHLRPQSPGLRSPSSAGDTHRTQRGGSKYHGCPACEHGVLDCLAGSDIKEGSRL